MLPDKRCKVLVVDDELGIPGILRAAGCNGRLRSGKGGQRLAALAKAQETHYDVSAPGRQDAGMDGLTVLKNLRESNLNTAVVVMTAHRAMQDTVEAVWSLRRSPIICSNPSDLEEMISLSRKLVQVQTLAMENLILEDRVATISRFENLVSQ